jgi:prepilin-type N-terminal cleavage/methylation domain-containing protein
MKLALRQSPQSGFSLLEMSIVLSIMAIVMAGALPFLLESGKSEDADDTVARMDAIEKAMAAYYTEKNSLPCPSDIRAEPETAAFGTAVMAGGCQSPGVSADQGTIRGGGVPVKDLGLSDEYAFDGWGRKIDYHIDARAANPSTFRYSGTLAVRDMNGNALTTTATYVLVSHGPNGHGGYTRANDTRFDAGSTSMAEAENCNNGGDPCNAPYDGVFVKNVPVQENADDSSSFYDDVVRYRTSVLIENASGGGAGGPWSTFGSHIANTNLGNVGIGTNAPQHRLHVSGGMQANYYNNTSDATQKSDIATAGGLTIIKQLRGVTFTWKDGGKSGMGVIAQEVEKVLPQAVSTGSDGIKSVEYNQLIAPMIEAIKELSRQNAELKAEIEALKAAKKEAK